MHFFTLPVLYPFLRISRHSDTTSHSYAPFKSANYSDSAGCSHRRVTESCNSQWASLLASTPAPMIPPTRTLPQIMLSDVGVMLVLAVCPSSRHSMRKASSLFLTLTVPGAVNSHVPFLLIATQSMLLGQSRNRTSTVSEVPLVTVAQPVRTSAHKAAPAIALMLYPHNSCIPGASYEFATVMQYTSNQRLATHTMLA